MGPNLPPPLPCPVRRAQDLSLKGATGAVSLTSIYVQDISESSWTVYALKTLRVIFKILCIKRNLTLFIILFFSINFFKAPDTHHLTFQSHPRRWGLLLSPMYGSSSCRRHILALGTRPGAPHQAPPPQLPEGSLGFVPHLLAVGQRTSSSQ